MMKLHLQNYIGASLLIMLVTSDYAYAAMYKWVDENGEVHYTQSPPPDGVTGETIQPPPKVDTDQALRELQEREDKINSINEERTKAAEEQKKTDETLAREKANCALAKDKLAQASGSTRLYGKDEQGNRVKLGEEDRQARIDAAKKDIAEFCK